MTKCRVMAFWYCQAISVIACRVVCFQIYERRFFVDRSKNSRFSVANDCCLLRPNDSLLRPNDGLLGPNDSLLGPNKSTMRSNNSIIRCVEEETGLCSWLVFVWLSFFIPCLFLALFLAFVYAKHGAIDVAWWSRCVNVWANWDVYSIAHVAFAPVFCRGLVCFFRGRWQVVSNG